MSTHRFFIKLVIFQSLLASLTISAGIYAGFLLTTLSYEHKLYPHTTIGGVDVSGLTAAQALEAVETSLLANNIFLTVDNATLTLSFTKAIQDTHVEEVIANAIQTSQNYSLREKIHQLKDLSQCDYRLTPTFNEALINELIEEISSLHTKVTQNASILITSEGHITYSPHELGVALDRERLLSAIYDSLENYKTTYIDISDFLVPLEPSITLEQLKAIDSKIVSFSTEFTPGTGNATNITLAASTINGTLLMPGDSFSFNDTIGDTTLEKGYTYAPVLVNSTPTPGVGGGVCQVSTTLYNAILKAGLLPTERRPHSKPSTYVPLGLDAVIDWGTLDFKFTNTLDTPLYIASYTKQGNIFIDLYSNNRLKDTTYELISEVYEVLPPNIKYITDKSLTSNTKSLVSQGQKGYRVRVIRKRYQNGTLMETELISNDTYKALPSIYKINS